METNVKKKQKKTFGQGDISGSVQGSSDRTQDSKGRAQHPQKYAQLLVQCLLWTIARM